MSTPQKQRIDNLINALHEVLKTTPMPKDAWWKVRAPLMEYEDACKEESAPVSSDVQFEALKAKVRRYDARYEECQGQHVWMLDHRSLISPDGDSYRCQRCGTRIGKKDYEKEIASKTK